MDVASLWLKGWDSLSEPEAAFGEAGNQWIQGEGSQVVLGLEYQEKVWTDRYGPCCSLDYGCRVKAKFKGQPLSTP